MAVIVVEGEGAVWGLAPIFFNSVGAYLFNINVFDSCMKS